MITGVLVMVLMSATGSRLIMGKPVAWDVEVL